MGDDFVTAFAAKDNIGATASDDGVRGPKAKDDVVFIIAIELVFVLGAQGRVDHVKFVEHAGGIGEGINQGHNDVDDRPVGDHDLHDLWLAISRVIFDRKTFGKGNNVQLAVTCGARPDANGVVAALRDDISFVIQDRHKQFEIPRIRQAFFLPDICIGAVREFDRNRRSKRGRQFALGQKFYKINHCPSPIQTCSKYGKNWAGKQILIKGDRLQFPNKSVAKTPLRSIAQQNVRKHRKLDLITVDYPSDYHTKDRHFSKIDSGSF